ncbi:MAG: HisA/HisF-related TIM barrel protein, partial [Cyanobacteria bacterium J06636_16]
TTLYGYTEETDTDDPPGFELLADIVTEVSVPCICEGGIASPQAASKAMELGAFAVVVGTAITGIDVLVQRYCHALSKVQS